MGKTGCGLVANIFLGIILLIFFAQSPLFWLFLVLGATGAVVFHFYNKRTNELKFLAGLDQQAQTLDALAAGQLANQTIAVALNKGESIVCILPNIALTEYQSTGATYSGGNAGISFPLAGSLRGNVGGQGGSFTKNPEQLMIIDQGQAIFTTQRILFSGSNFVRDWELDKVVTLEPGPNGVDVKIAVTNRDRTSGLRSIDFFSFGPGYAAAYVFNLKQNGAASAKKWAKDLATEIRTLVATAPSRQKAATKQPNAH